MSAVNAAEKPKIEAWVWRISACVVLGSIMSILDTTIVNVALDTLSRDLNASISQIQWVVTGYMLSLAAVIPITGWAARRFGAKRVYILSLILFTGGSALCGLAQSTNQLILFRVLQGAGGGMILPLGQLMMAEAAGPQRMGRVMSIISIPSMLAPILGPTIGGLILAHLSWRWIFYVNLPVGIVALIASIRILPKVAPAPTNKLDIRGFILMATGLPLLTFGLAEIGSTGSITSPKALYPIIGGLLLIAVFCWHALRVPKPLLNLRLYRRTTFSAASFAMFCLAAALFGGMVLLPLYWQTIRGQSVVDTGLLTAPTGLGMILVMPLAGRLTDRFGGGPLALLGVTVTAIFTIPLVFVGTHTPIPLIGLSLFFRGMGVGFAFMPAMAAAFASLRRSELADATPQLNVFQRVGGSIGTAVLAVILQRALSDAHTPSQAAGAYGTAFLGATVLTALAIIPCIILVRAERNARRSKATASVPAEALAEAVAA